LAGERLDLKSARYDSLARSVVIDGRGVTVEIALEALEALAKRKLSPDQAVARALGESKRIIALVKRLPPDDGKITITTGILMNDGLFGENGEA
jgi:16S rRNA G527 N7-methylase RsmG